MGQGVEAPFFEIANVEPVSPWVFFTLTQTPANGQCPAAINLSANNRDIAQPIIVYDRPDGQVFLDTAKNTDKGLAVWSATNEKYYIAYMDQQKPSPITGSAEIVRYELREALDPSFSAEAELIEWSGTNWTLTGTKVYVLDFTVQGWWRGIPASGGQRGYQGQARLISDVIQSSGSISSVSNDGGKANFASEAHGLTAGQLVNITDGLHNGLQQITAVLVNNFTTDRTFVGNATGVWSVPVFEVMWQQQRAAWIMGFLSENMSAVIANFASVTVTDFGNGEDPSHPFYASPIRVHDVDGQFTGRASGSWFFATFDRVENEYKFVWIESRFGKVKVTLSANLTRSTGSLANCTVTETLNGPSPGATITVFNIAEVHGSVKYVFAAKSGDVALATYDPESDKWWLDSVSTVAKFIEFTLDEDVSGGPPQADATVDAFHTGYDPGATVIVYVTQGIYTFAKAGAKGRAVWDDETNHYVVQTCQLPAAVRIIKDGTVTTLADWLLTDDQTGTFDVTGYIGEGHSLADETGITCYNWPRDGVAGQYMFRMGPGTEGIAEFNTENGHFEITMQFCENRDEPAS